jgi:hypothetical protein
MGEPWDQLPTEPDEAYSRFLLYRNLGPGRSLHAAYLTYLTTFRNASDDIQTGKKRQQVPGFWGADSGRWKWVDRANAWDHHVLHTHGERLSILWVGILTTAAEKCAQKLAQPNCRPKDFMQCMAVVDKLSAFLSPDAVQSIQPPAGDPGPRKPVTKQSVK